MIKNYLKIAWRNLWKSKVFSFINIAGLSAGIAFALLIGAYVWSELQINHHLKNADRQYFLQSKWTDPNMGVEFTSVGPLAERLHQEYPNLVNNYYRWDGITSVVSKGDQHFRENIQLGDSTLLDMFGFTLLQGNSKTALVNPFSVVITADIAIKYFGKTDVIGETLDIQSFSGGNHNFTVTGVLAYIPENSVTQLNDENHNTIFIPGNSYNYFGRAGFETWANRWAPSYIELKPGITAKDLVEPIKHLLATNAPADIQKNLTVQPIPLTNYYLNKNNRLARRMLYTLSAIGLFILLMAIINFINIAISSAGKRTKEIGVRKVMGGLRSQLIAQFLAESLILVILATALAVLAYPLARKAFGGIVGKEIPSLSSFPLYFIAAPVLLIIVVALLAGSYPAFVLSALKTVDSLKGKLKSVQENILLRKSLVGFQFFIAMLVLIASIIITQQVSYFFSRDLGYNNTFIVSSQVPRDWTPQGARKMETIRNQFAQLPQVSDVSLSYEIPNGMNGGQPPVYKAGADAGTALPMQAMVTDEHYLSTYQIPLASGSFFSGAGLDSGKVIINEQAVKALGYANNNAALGQQLRIPGDPTVFIVKGITRDFHFASMQQKIAPIIFFNVRFSPTYRYLSFKLKPGNIGAAIETIQKQWASLLPGSSFEYRFMDDALASLYASEIQLKKAAYTATVLSMLIMLLGVLGLIALSIHKRIKEIGIRKVLGASVSNIIMLFIKEFMLIILPAAAMAIPVANILMNSWLNNYAYRIHLSPQAFVLAVLALALVTTLLIGLQTVRAALSNPVKSLRTE